MKLSESNLENTPRWFKIMNAIILAVLIALAVFLMLTDAGNMSGSSTGAGDIWWVDAPEVNESYNTIVDQKNNK
ncbi:hypothetical protein GGQ84_000659 [Desulfitispora alkaliphila]